MARPCERDAHAPLSLARLGAGVCANFHGKGEKYLRYNGIHIHYSNLSYFEMQEFEVQ